MTISRDPILTVDTEGNEVCDPEWIDMVYETIFAPESLAAAKETGDMAI